MSRRRGAKELFTEPDSIGGFVGNVGVQFAEHADTSHYMRLSSAFSERRARCGIKGDRLYVFSKRHDGVEQIVPLDSLLHDLMAFIFEIEKTGGICKRDTDGVMADPEWIDLRDTYLTACAHLGRLPVIDGKRRLPAKKKHADRNLL